MAVALLNFVTAGFIHRFFRDPNDRCLIFSTTESVDKDGGISTFRSSFTNWDSWECVLEQKKI